MCYDKEIATSLQMEGAGTNRLESPMSEMPLEKGMESAAFENIPGTAFRIVFSLILYVLMFRMLHIISNNDRIREVL